MPKKIKTQIITSVSPKQLASQNQKIPRIISQTFKTATVPQEMFRALLLTAITKSY